ncbi:hypothetical protein Tco_0763244 [Tanacetum coccineum]
MIVQSLTSLSSIFSNAVEKKKSEDVGGIIPSLESSEELKEVLPDEAEEKVVAPSQFKECLWLGGHYEKERAEFKIIEPGFELIDQEQVEMGRIPLVRLEMRSRGFKASILHLIYVLGASWDFLDQRFAAIDGYRRRGVGVIE